jgi:hypothetical protein
MPPFPLAAFHSQSRFEGRQNGASAVDVVLSITRESTTYTTTIGLTPSTPPASNPTSVPTISQAPTPHATSPNTPNIGVVVGAILGSILGTLVLITVFYKCCIDNRSALYARSQYSSYDSDTDSGHSSFSDRVRTRGGGFEHHNRHSGVRSPHRTRTRRHRNMSERSGSRSEISWGSRNRRRRRSSMTKRNGMLGWRLAPRTKDYDTYERRWPRDRRDKDFLPDD